jgi:hypothetical protein
MPSALRELMSLSSEYCYDGATSGKGRRRSNLQQASHP